MFGKTKGKLSIITTLTTVVSFGLVLTFAQTCAFAALKDTDYDGITDGFETSTYKTDPNNADTDSDSYLDGVEVIAKSDPLSKDSTPQTIVDSTEIPLFQRTDPIFWYISRISGITAFILLTMVVLLGLTQTSKILIKYKFMSFMTALETHRAIAWFAGISVITHFGSLFFDQFFKLNILEVLIPFKLVRPTTSALGFNFTFTVSLGILAIYFILILIATSELRRKVIPVKIWRLIHYISSATYILFLAHAVLSGTDSKEWWMIAIYVTSFVLVMGMGLAKMFKQKLFLSKGPEVKSTNDQTIQTDGQTVK